MGSLYKRGNRYTAQFAVGGVRRQVALATSSRRVATALLHRLEHAYVNGKWNPLRDSPDVILRPRPSREITPPGDLGDRITAFIESKAALRPKTLRNYQEILDLYRREGSSLPTFLSRRRGTTKHTYYRHLRVFYNWQIKQGWISRNPCDDIALPRSPQREATFFTREQISQIVSCIQADTTPREAAYLPQMVEFVCYTGLRLSEVCALKWADVDGDQLVLRTDQAHKEWRHCNALRS